MGYDVYGQKPIKESGEYFRNDLPWWWPLWIFTTSVCGDILTERDLKLGKVNDGHLISGRKAVAVANRLKDVLKNKDKYSSEAHAAEHSENHIENAVIAALGLKKHTRGCRFSWDNVADFAEFCRNSGGFRIW